MSRFTEGLFEMRACTWFTCKSRFWPDSNTYNEENVSLGCYRFLWNRKSALVQTLKWIYLVPAASAKHKEKTRAAVVAPIESPVAVNHLFLGRRVAVNSNKRNRHVAIAPSIAPIYPNGPIPLPSMQIQPGNGSPRKQSTSSKKSSQSSPSKSQSEASSSVACTGKSSSSSPLDDQSQTSGAVTPTPRPGGRVRTVSGTSLYSDMETASLHVPDETDVASITTATDCESIASDATDIATIDSEEPKDKMDTPVTSNEAKDSDEISNSLKDSSIDIERTDTLSDSDTVNEYNSSDRENSDKPDNQEVVDNVNCDDMNKESESRTIQKSPNQSPVNGKVANDEIVFHNNNNQISDDSPKKVSENAPTLLQLSRCATEMDFTEKIRQQNINPVKTESSAILNNSENNAEYIAKLTYKGHKNGQPSTADSIAREYYQAKSQSAALDEQSESISPSAKNAKSFNPFPSRHINRNRTQNGIRLGLYSADSMPVMEGFTKKQLGGGKQVSRAQINACLHRQYMAEIKQQAKGYKQW